VRKREVGGSMEEPTRKKTISMKRSLDDHVPG
jgi:hypothetical protein